MNETGTCILVAAFVSFLEARKIMLGIQCAELEEIKIHNGNHVFTSLFKNLPLFLQITFQQFFKASVFDCICLLFSWR